MKKVIALLLFFALTTGAVATTSTPVYASNKGTVKITCNVIGATISGNVNGTIGSGGFASWNNLTYGTYNFTVSAAGYTTATGSVTLASSSVTKAVTLTAATGTVKITCNVIGATISGDVNGTIGSAGFASWKNLAYGTYNFTVSAAGYTTATGSVTLASSSVTKAVTLTAATGTVKITCNVIGATISGDVNGTIGSAGFASWNNLTYGTYNFTVSAAGYTTVTDSVTLSSGSANKSVTLTAATGTVKITCNVIGATISGDVNGTIGSAGFASWNNLAYGTYNFTISAAGYTTVTDSVTLSSGSANKSVTLTAATGTVKITCNVIGATISGDVNGTIGSAGFASWNNLAYGTYNFTISAAGYTTVTDSVTLSSGSANKSVTLTAATGTVKITCNVIGATISGDVNGTIGSAGFASWNNLTYGTYNFTVSAAGYTTVTDSVTLSSGSANKSVTLTAATGTVKITCNVIGATISGDVNGTIGSAGFASWNNLTYGTYNFTISAAGYTTVTDSVTLSSGSANKSVTLTAATGTVKITCNVIGATISGDVNGTIGSAGFASWNNLAYGTYNFTISAAGYTTVTDSVTLSSGSANKSVTLTAATGTVKITCNVIGATISGDVNGTIGSAGFASWNNLAYGTYNFTISAAGYTTVTDSVTLSSGSANKSVTLTAATGTVKITCNVIGATISGDVNGTIGSAGFASWNNLAYGTYNFTVSAAGYTTVTDSVTLSSGSANKSVTLTAATGTVKITCNVIGATIKGSVNGTIGSGGFASWNNLAYGTYNFTISATGYTAVTSSVVLSSASAEKTITLVATPTTGDLRINCNVIGATIKGSVNGTIGRDGYASWNNLAYGTYNFTISAAGYTTVTSSVVLSSVSAEKTITLVATPTTGDLRINCNVIGATIKGSVNGTIGRGGYASWNNLAYGTYNFTISAAGYTTVTSSVVLSSASAEKTITLVAAPTAGNLRINCNVVGATITGDLNGTINENGYMCWNNIPCKTYKITITAAGYVTKSYSFIFQTANQTINVTLGAMVGTGNLKITCNVIGATISGDVNGTIGSAGFASWNNLAYGTYNFTISATGYTTVTSSVVLSSASAEKTITLVATPTTGDLRINCNVIGATIKGSVNGTIGSAGFASWNNLAYGTYNFTISAAGYTTVTDSVTLSSGSANKSVTLTAATGTVKITCNVIGATIKGSVNGTIGSGGFASWNNLAYGTYNFTISATGYTAVTSSVVLSSASAEKTITLVATPTTGDLRINCNVIGATIKGSVNGTIGSGGFASWNNLAYGTYNFTISATGYTTVTSSVVLSSASAEKTITLVATPTTGDLRINCNVIGATIKGSVNGTIGRDGYASWNNLAYGTYNFTISAAGYTTVTSSVVLSSVSAEKTITLVAAPTAGNLRINCNVVGATITGDLNGTINENGYMSWNNIPCKTYKITITAAGYVTKSYSFIFQTANQTINVTLGAMVGTGNLTIKCNVPGATITGDVGGSTDSNGSATWNNIAYKTYNFTISAVGYTTVSDSVILSSASVTKNVVLEVTPVIMADGSKMIILTVGQCQSFHDSDWTALGDSSVTDFVIIPNDATQYGGTEAGYIANLAPIIVDAINNLVGKRADAKIWIGTPLITGSNWTVYADESLDSFYNYITYIKSAISASRWANNIRGVYMSEEAVYGSVNYSNLLDNPCIRLMNDLAYRVHNNLNKKYLWIPYYGFGMNPDLTIKNIAYVIDKNTIFDYAIIQPRYYFNQYNGTAQGGSSNTIQLQAVNTANCLAALAVDSYYVGQQISLTGGLGSGDVRKIIAYDGKTRTATVDSDFSEVPNEGTTYKVNETAIQANLDRIYDSVISQMVHDRNGQPVLSKKNSNTIIGAEMESSSWVQYTTQHPEYKVRYDEYVAAFSNLVGNYPIGFYWDGQLSYSLDNLVNPFYK